MITNRERERQTLDFEKPEGRGSVQETFPPWSITIERFVEEGLPIEIANGVLDITNDMDGNDVVQEETYLQVKWGEGVMKYEEYLGFDSVRRIHFALPFRQSVITGWEDWEALKKRGDRELKKCFTDEQIEKVYGHLKLGHEKGDYSIRLHLEGFFWVPRELMGIEEHLFAFYDEPELLHDMSKYMLKVYQNQLMKVIELVQPDMVYILEDLSGVDGPMISPEYFDEFIGAYYKELFPLFKKAGVRHVIVDTDGDFEKLIPNFIKAGAEGFLPMDVNAGMDIVEIRKKFPNLKFIGSYNKLEISKGKEAIDKEFERLLPIIRQGGFIPAADHQIAPCTSLENYRYYIAKLKEVMKQAGADILA